MRTTCFDCGYPLDVDEANYPSRPYVICPDCESKREVDTVVIFFNGEVAVIDKKGRQIGRLQGLIADMKQPIFDAIAVQGHPPRQWIGANLI